MPRLPPRPPDDDIVPLLRKASSEDPWAPAAAPRGFRGLWNAAMPNPVPETGWPDAASGRRRLPSAARRSAATPPGNADWNDVVNATAKG